MLRPLKLLPRSATINGQYGVHAQVVIMATGIGASFDEAVIRNKSI